MPIITPKGGGNEKFNERLAKAGIKIISEEDAKTQDIRPARIGLLNLMPAPAMEVTETQWLKWIGSTLLQIEPVFIKFDNDKRENDGASRQKVLKRYTPFSEVAINGLDGLIITGDNLEIQQHVGFASRDPLPFEDIRYYKQLCEIIDWADKNVGSTIYSCLGAHFALNYKYGLNREVSNEKIFGIYEHARTSTISNFTAGMNDNIKSPHSRWGNIPVSRVDLIEELQVLAVNSSIGWLAIESTNKSQGKDLYLQGHPEYDQYDLHTEYQRDKKEGRAIPENYYANNDPKKEDVSLSWISDARVLHENWISHVYSQYSAN
jgi:homoserine O-succinyltransferase